MPIQNKVAIFFAVAPRQEIKSIQTADGLAVISDEENR
jgi:hypothetical protein